MSKYESIADDLRAMVASLRSGAALPRQAELAERYAVNVKTIRHAVAVLEAEGLVTSVRRRGTIVSDGPTDWRARALRAEAQLRAVREAINEGSQPL